MASGGGGGGGGGGGRRRVGLKYTACFVRNLKNSTLDKIDNFAP